MRKQLRTGFEYIERGFDAAFTPQWNPLLQLGALGWFFYWIVVVTGIYLYIFFDTGIFDAYDSVERLTHEQWYIGGVMRSLHRYASDAMIIVVFLHVLREFVMDRFRGKRWFAWVTGVALLWLIYASGISGYWMVWDKLAQYVAVGTAEWFDALGIFGKPISRDFLNESTLSSRFFTLLIFIHIAAPLLLLFGMWIHIQRQTKPKVNPPIGLAAGTFAMLLAVSFLSPAVSQGRANLDEVPATIGIDWFYLFIYPLRDHYSSMMLWGFIIGGTILMGVLPWLPPTKKKQAAEVNLENCNGCGRCVSDCPTSAVDLAPRTDGLNYEQQAVVNPNVCTSCGICMGACPTATPFRRTGNASAGIELPDDTLEQLKSRVLEQAEKLTGPGTMLVFTCDGGPDVTFLENRSDAAVISLPCIGMLPPPFMDYIISRRYASGILFAACREIDCHYRLGMRWTDQRINRTRDPYLRNRTPRDRIKTCRCGITETKRLAAEAEEFRKHLLELDLAQQAKPVTEEKGFADG